jgi:7,8-dihydropterin-6-yl-methyl-4-(beta-D-ribofuranosyl)aminobenzene 5'-phosphate synthase
MKVTIVYDNETWQPGLEADWGFSCLVEEEGRRWLFDTGAKGAVLLANMQKLGIDPQTITAIFISHAHWDHLGDWQICCALTTMSGFTSPDRAPGLRRPER